MFSGPRPPLLLPEADFDYRRGTRVMEEQPCCLSPSYTPPIIVFVPPFRPPRSDAVNSGFHTPGRAYDYDADLERALSESFEESRDVEPQPASERTLCAIAKRTETLKADETCGICLQRMLMGEAVLLSGCCGARCHRDCMEKALLATPSCPFCRWSADL